MKRAVFLFFFLIIALNPLRTQTEEERDLYEEGYHLNNIEKRDFDEKNWEKLTEDLDYEVKEPPPPRTRERNGAPRSPLLPGLGKGLLTALAIIIAAIVLGFLIAILAGLIELKNPKVKKSITVSLDDIEEKMFDMELQPLIKEAINKKDYELAIRLYFLLSLKMLSLEEKIKWKKDKTNRIYYYELAATKLATPFQELSLLFDRIRYGKEEVDALRFKPLEQRFKSFLNMINPNIYPKES